MNQEDKIMNKISKRVVFIFVGVLIVTFLMLYAVLFFLGFYSTNEDFKEFGELLGAVRVIPFIVPFAIAFYAAKFANVKLGNKESK